MASHWLTRPSTRRVLWILFVLMLAGTLIAEHFVHRHAHFALEAWTGFNAVFGFLVCAVMILVAKAIGLVLKRPQGYYGDE